MAQVVKCLLSKYEGLKLNPSTKKKKGGRGERRKELGSGSSCQNPSYSGDRYQEDQGSKPAQANPKRPNIRKGCWSGSRHVCICLASKRP
jgi:hypothetical protein